MSTEAPAPTYYTPTDDGPIWPEIWPASVGYFKSRAGHVTTDKRESSAEVDWILSGHGMPVLEAR